MILILPFLTSVGSLLFEFSLSHFLSISLGDSSFGFAFVIGVFLLFMGVGAYGSGRRATWGRPALIAVEAALALLCLAALPALAQTAGALRAWQMSSESCRSLLCTREGLGLIAEAGLWLAATGMLVGAEIPLFLRLSGQEAGRVLAADYLGAFVAGLAFPLWLLPRLGSFGTLLLAAGLHLFVGTRLAWWGAERTRWAPWALGPLWLALGAIAWRLEPCERWLLQQVLTDPLAERSELSFYRRTRRQSVAIVVDTLADGQRDTRLYLEGYLQFSSAWNTEAYHRTMALPARARIKAPAAEVLVLGGGDGLLARALKDARAADHVVVADFDCELLTLARAPGPLNALSRDVWSSPGVEARCADAFWLARNPAERGRWDLVLVDFPHGVGDAAAERVESFEFFRDLHVLLKPGGWLVVQHERYGSTARECVQETLAAAGFATEALAVRERDPSSEAMILGQRAEFRPSSVDVHRVQTLVRTRCARQSPFGRILSGA